MSVNKERLKILADAGSRGRKAYRQLQKLVNDSFLRARSGEQDWESSLRELYELGQEHLLWPQAATDAAVIEVEQERLRLTWSKNELSKKASERRRRNAGAIARTSQAQAPQAPEPEPKPFQLTAQELEEIRQLRSKYEPRAQAQAQAPAAQELEPGKDPFNEEEN